MSTEIVSAERGIALHRAVDALTEYLDRGWPVGRLPRQTTPGVVDPDDEVIAWKLDSRLTAPRQTEYIDGIVLAIVYGRLAYPHSYGHGKRSRPCCASIDMETGHGAHGPDCATCPLNDPEAQPADDEPRCHDRAWVVFQQQGRLLPTVIQAPRTSVESLAGYEAGLLAERGLRLWQVVTRLRLKVKTTGNGRSVAMNPSPADRRRKSVGRRDRDGPL